MGIDEIKRWQWLLIGLLIGFGLGWTQSGQDNTLDEGRLISQPDFEREITNKNPKTGEPLIKDIVLQPITTDYKGAQVQPVTFLRLQQGAKTGRTIYVPAQYIASVPYKPVFGWRGAGTKPNLADYLAEVAKSKKDFTFHYGWYHERTTAIALWTVGSAIVVGGIWPTLLNLISGAGFGGVREKKAKKENYFDRFTRGPEKSAPVAAKVVTAAEHQKLDDLTAALERDLASAVPEDGTVNIPADQKSPAEIRQLQGGPVEAAAIAKSPGDDDEVEIKGEYYPVLIHHKKTHDDEEETPKS